MRLVGIGWGSAARRLAASLACLAIFCAAPSRAQEQPREDESDAKLFDDPMETFRNIESAWQKSSAQEIASLASESPIFIEIRGLDRKGGYFTKPQLYYIFKQMFEGTNQVSFQFIKFRNLEKPDRRVYGVAHRKYRNLRRGAIYEDTVYITLVKEGSRWAVAEIKSTW
jgi:hypothetical protein